MVFEGRKARLKHRQQRGDEIGLLACNAELAVFPRPAQARFDERLQGLTKRRGRLLGMLIVALLLEPHGDERTPPRGIVRWEVEHAEAANRRWRRPKGLVVFVLLLIRYQYN